MVKSIRGVGEWISDVWFCHIDFEFLLHSKFPLWEVNQWLMQYCSDTDAKLPSRSAHVAAILFMETARQFRGKLVVAPESGQWNRTHCCWVSLVNFRTWITGSKDYTNYNDTWRLNAMLIMSTCLQPCVFTFTKDPTFLWCGAGPLPLVPVNSNPWRDPPTFPGLPWRSPDELAPVVR